MARPYIPAASRSRSQGLSNLLFFPIRSYGDCFHQVRTRERYNFDFSTKCDVEIILHLYANGGVENVAKNLDGVFAFCLVDVDKRRIVIGRDPYGVRPLFVLRGNNGELGICSESKGLVGIYKDAADWRLEPFPPGYAEEYEITMEGTVKLLRKLRYHKPGDEPSFDVFVPWEDLKNRDPCENISKLLSTAIEKRLMADRRIGCLLSGGLDSSLVAALLVKHAKDKNFTYKIQSFAIGMDNSPDILAARQVAEYIGTEHHEIIFTADDVAEVLDDVIYSLESFDITTVRASIGMYLLSRYIKRNTDTTVIFSGEGADELAQGYIYFRDAPNSKEAHDESLRLLGDIYLYDGLRADRTTSAHSLELRVPFLDLQFTHYYLSLDPELRCPRGGIEKHLLRSSFDGSNLLPKNILWRHKEAFSDGVTSIKKSLFQIIDDIVKCKVSDDDLIAAQSASYPIKPQTKEAYYYRKIFEKHFGMRGQYLIPYLWMPRWIKDVTDPSARFIKHYTSEEKKCMNGKIENA